MAPHTEDYNPLALSPDGKTLVYVGMANGKQQLFLRRLDRNEIRPIPDMGGPCSRSSPRMVWRSASSPTAN